MLPEVLGLLPPSAMSLLVTAGLNGSKTSDQQILVGHLFSIWCDNYLLCALT